MSTIAESGPLFPVKTYEDCNAEIQKEIQEHEKTSEKASKWVLALFALGFITFVGYAIANHEISVTNSIFISSLTVVGISAIALICINQSKESFRKDKTSELEKSKIKFLTAQQTLDCILENGLEVTELSPSVVDLISKMSNEGKRHLLYNILNKTSWLTFCKYLNYPEASIGLSRFQLLEIFTNHLKEPKGLTFEDIEAFLNHSAFSSQKEGILNDLKLSEEYLHSEVIQTNEVEKEGKKTNDLFFDEERFYELINERQYAPSILMSMLHKFIQIKQAEINASSDTLETKQKAMLSEVVNMCLNQLKLPKGLKLKDIEAFLDESTFASQKAEILRELKSSPDFVRIHVDREGDLDRAKLGEIFTESKGELPHTVLEPFVSRYLTDFQKSITRENILFQARYYDLFSQVAGVTNYPKKWAEWFEKNKEALKKDKVKPLAPAAKAIAVTKEQNRKKAEAIAAYLGIPEGISRNEFIKVVKT